MNIKDKKLLSQMPSEELDRALNDEFPGIEAKTTYRIVAMNHQTFWRKDMEHSEAEVEAFISGFMRGHKALGRILLRGNLE